LQHSPQLSLDGSHGELEATLCGGYIGRLEAQAKKRYSSRQGRARAYPFGEVAQPNKYGAIMADGRRDRIRDLK
jgi:hypothetical protein